MRLTRLAPRFHGIFWAVIATALFLAAWRPAALRHPKLRSGTEAAVVDFRITGGQEDSSPDRFKQAVFSLSGLSGWWGSYAPDDNFTGTLISNSFPLHGKALQIPIIGYPASPGNRLVLQILHRDFRVDQEVVFSGTNPLESPGVWQVDIRQWPGRLARISLTDGLNSPRGWLGVAAPRYGVFRGITWLYATPRNYGWFSIVSLSVIGLLFIPGLLYNILGWGHFRLPFSLVPLPSLVITSLVGLILWRCQPAVAPFWPLAWLTLHGLGALTLAFSSWRGAILDRRDSFVGVIYLCSVTGALAFGVSPAGVTQEFSTHSTAQARMIASPPDHIIPYYTAGYFSWGFDGKKNSTEYFGNSWTVGSRGPLVPFIIAVGFDLFGDRPTAPPGGMSDYWPASGDGFYIARVIGIETNALVILGIYALETALVGGWGIFAATWLGVSPLLLLNLDFLWPKLLATYFLLLAIRFSLRPGQAGPAAFFGALAYYSHPVGALLLPMVGVYLIMGDPPGTLPKKLRHFCGFFFPLVLLLSPWLAYKYWLHSEDLFLRYPLGDGNGFARALSGLAWLRARWNNIWYTLAPFAFYASSKMPSWIDGPLSSLSRWGISYAKSLPGTLGILSYIISLIAVVAHPPGRLRSFGIVYIVASFLLMLLFWGYSDDGLGRNCLEPLAALYIVYAGVALLPFRRLRFVVLVLTATEAMTLRIIGVLPEVTAMRLTQSPEVVCGLLGSALPFILIPSLYLVGKQTRAVVAIR